MNFLYLNTKVYREILPALFEKITPKELLENDKLSEYKLRYVRETDDIVGVFSNYIIVVSNKYYFDRDLKEVLRDYITGEIEYNVITSNNLSDFYDSSFFDEMVVLVPNDRRMSRGR